MLWKAFKFLSILFLCLWVMSHAAILFLGVGVMTAAKFLFKRHFRKGIKSSKNQALPKPKYVRNVADARSRSRVF